MTRNRALKGLVALLGAAVLSVAVAAPSADAQTPAKKDPENANRTLVWIPKTVNSTSGSPSGRAPRRRRRSSATRKCSTRARPPRLTSPARSTS